MKGGTEIKLIYRMATVNDVKDTNAPRETRELWKLGSARGGVHKVSARERSECMMWYYRILNRLHVRWAARILFVPGKDQRVFSPAYSSLYLASPQARRNERKHFPAEGGDAMEVDGKGPRGGARARRRKQQAEQEGTSPAEGGYDDVEMQEADEVRACKQAVLLLCCSARIDM